MAERFRMHPTLLSERFVNHLPAKLQISNAYAPA